MTVLMHTRCEQVQDHFQSAVLIFRSVTSMSKCCFYSEAQHRKANPEIGNVEVENAPLATKKQINFK